MIKVGKILGIRRFLGDFFDFFAFVDFFVGDFGSSSEHSEHSEHSDMPTTFLPNSVRFNIIKSKISEICFLC